MNASRLLPLALALACAPALAAPIQTLGPAPWLDPMQPDLWLPVAPKAKALTILLPIATGSRRAVVNAYNTYYVSAMPSMNFTGSIGGCSPGLVSSAFKDFTLSRVNYYRAMAGLPGNVVHDLSTTRETEGQSAAVLFSANQKLDHAPANPPFTSCTNLLAAANNAASGSNIALSFGDSTADDVVPRYIDESDGSGPVGTNANAGHRRWILYPPQATMLNASTPTTFSTWGANALRVTGGFGTRPATLNGVAWPPAGYVPMQLLPTSKRWSYSFNNADFSNATVTVTANGTPIGVNIVSKVDNGYGDNTIVFEHTPAIVAGTNYIVTVSGMAGSGVPATTSYSVRPIDTSATIPGVNGDFNGNGASDLLFTNADGRHAIWLMNGTAPTATAEVIGAGTGWSVSNVADFNGDGKTDLLWQHTDGRMAIYLMNGAAPTATQQILNAGGGWSVTHTPDLNGDGKADLVFQNVDGSVAIWTMNGATMTGGTGILGAGTGWSVIRTADFDGDGNDDLLFRHTDGRHAIWLMNGLAVKSTAQILNAGGWTATHTPDLNGDGKADIVWQHTDGTIAVWLMNGTAMTTGTGLLGAGTGWSVTHAGDFDGDGRADLFFLHTDGRAAIYLMNGTTPTATTQILNAGGGWSVKRLVDLNGDGKADIVWQNTDGSTAIWLMNGTTMTSGAGILGTGTGWTVTPVSQ
ncbi:hypothetical protein BWI17_14650 [Betaproteobacteria bacterium GR16-43]|nr:hypothetical protein BWI17_14650 [Betaproteobacteria bacterium GR16-43]